MITLRERRRFLETAFWYFVYFGGHRPGRVLGFEHPLEGKVYTFGKDAKLVYKMVSILEPAHFVDFGPVAGRVQVHCLNPFHEPDAATRYLHQAAMTHLNVTRVRSLV